MQSNSLLAFHAIVFQCHNDPDADAYCNGYGVEQDLETGIIWLGKTAKQGQAEAQRALAQLNEMEGTDEIERKRPKTD